MIPDDIMIKFLQTNYFQGKEKIPMFIIYCFELKEWAISIYKIIFLIRYNSINVRIVFMNI